MGIFGNKTENFKVLLTNQETGEEKYIKDKTGVSDRIWLSKTEASIATNSVGKEFKIKIIKV